MSSRGRARRTSRTQPVFTLSQERLLTRMLDRSSRPTKLVGASETVCAQRLAGEGLIVVDGGQALLTEQGRAVAERLARGEEITRVVEVAS